MSDDSTLKLRVLPLGGLGEIGLNMMIVALGKDAFIIGSQGQGCRCALFGEQTQHI